MFTRSSGSSVIDSVTVVEGKFSIHPDQPEPIMEVQVMYSNREHGTRFGTCPVKETLLSERTLETFRQFTEQVEEDFGNLVLEGGILVRIPGASALGAETQEGLNPKGLGEG